MTAATTTAADRPSRRAFLRLRRHEPPALRPPWAAPQAVFSDLCDRCGDCLPACGEGILVRGDGGFPTVDFSRGECTFCGDCAAACPTPALTRTDPAAPPWQLTAVIGDGCLTGLGVVCRSCGEACPTAAITFRMEVGRSPQPRLDPAACTGCGACVAPCPAAAVSVQPFPPPTTGDDR